jgi:hypothetical protein
MTYTARPDVARQTSETTRHVVTTILAVAGIVAAALGAWMYWGPDAGTLTLYGWTWNVADLSELWAPFLMIGGGLVAALSMGIETYRDWEAEHNGWLIGFEGLVAVVGIAAIVIGIILLF